MKSVPRADLVDRRSIVTMSDPEKVEEEEMKEKGTLMNRLIKESERNGKGWWVKGCLLVVTLLLIIVRHNDQCNR